MKEDKMVTIPISEYKKLLDFWYMHNDYPHKIVMRKLDPPQEKGKES